jgi:hypothetical protein
MESSGELDGFADLFAKLGLDDAAKALRGRKVHRKRGQKPGTAANIRQVAAYQDYYFGLAKRDDEGRRVPADVRKQAVPRRPSARFSETQNL